MQWGDAAAQTAENTPARLLTSARRSAMSTIDWQLTEAPTGATEAPSTLAGVTQLQTNIAFAVMAAIIAVGSIGNSVVLYVYSKKRDRQTANIFILSLAITDTVACILVIPMTIGMEAVRFRTNFFLCKLYYLLNASEFPFSCLLMTAIAVDRYFCICRPFLRAITIPRARAIVLALGSLAVTLGLTTSAFCSGVVDQFGPNQTWQYAEYGFCKEINDMKSLNSSSELKISDASLAFFHVFQKVHVSLFCVCIVVVFVLYISIYRSVLAMRRKRRELKGQRQPSKQQKRCEASEMQDRRLLKASISSQPATAEARGRRTARFAEPSGEAEAAPAQENGAEAESNEVPPAGVAATPADVSSATELLKRRRKSLRLTKDSDALQNLKTAAMLFVVTIVFACTFVPAALMSQGLVDFHIVVFYLYYLTHATNPLIYCFMNQNFRDDLRKFFCHGGRRGHRGATGGGGVSGVSGVGETGGGGGGGGCGSQRQPTSAVASTTGLQR